MAAFEDSIDVESLGEYREEIVEDTEEEEDYDLEFQGTVTGWRRIFHLPFEPVWAYTVLVIGVFQTYKVIYDSGFKIYGTKDEIDVYSAAYTRFKSAGDSIKNIDFTAAKYFSDMIYLIDILLIIGCKMFHKLQIDPLEIRRPNWVIFLELLSITPLELLIPMNPVTPFKAKLFYFVQLNDCLKTVRIYYKFYYDHNMVGNAKVYLQLMEYYFSMGAAVMIGAAVTYNIICSNTICGKPSLQDYTFYLYVSVSKLTTRGIAEYPDISTWMLSFTIVGLLAFLGIASVSIGYVAIALFTSLYHRYEFLSKLKLTHNELVKLHIPKDLTRHCMAYFDMYWKMRTGYQDHHRYFLTLPQAMYAEMKLDVSWAAMKHSKLLRNMDIPFLRLVAVYFESRFMQAGRIIYTKNYPKAMMVYVVSGVVQILSEEDDETPILSFSGGTCLGESCLILNCISKATVRCKTYCNLNLLYRKDFMDVIKQCPSHFHRARKTFMERINSAKRNSARAELVNVSFGMKERTNRVTIMWLKNTLHRLMMNDGDTSMKHECQNVFLRDEYTDEQFKDKCFSAKYLDMLAISERLELVTDTIFLKTTCPCIIQPDCVVLATWEGLIIILTVVTAVLAPYFAFVQPVSPLWYKGWIYVITMSWMLDVYIQISTAVKTPEQIIATVTGIFFYRMKTAGFLTDLFAAFPLEICSSILVRQVTPQYYALMYLNRVLKIWRLRRMFEHFENRLNANVLLIRHFKYFCLFVYTIYLSSCALYAFNCFNSVCTQELLENSVHVHLLWCVVVVTHLLSGASLVSRLTDNPLYYPIYLILTVMSTFFFVFVYGSLAAEHALKRVHKVKVQDELVEVIRIIKAKNLDRKYRSRIFRYIETQWIDNSAMQIIYGHSAFTQLTVAMQERLKEKIYRSVLISAPIFEDLPDVVIFDLCSVVRETILPPNEIVCYTGEICNTFHIIQSGYCKVISSVTQMKQSSIGPSELVAVLEACLHVPIVNTVATVTHCRLLSIEMDSMKRVFLKFPSHLEDYNMALQRFKAENSVSLSLLFNHVYSKYTVTEETRDTKSFRKFGYNLREDSLEEYDYYIPFDRLDFFSFVQYFLLRYTILPQGKFLFNWEIVRSICAVLSGLLFPLNDVGTCTDCEFYFFLVFLDAMAWLDMYVRMHVGYYDESGILITHPLKTSIHYLKTSFVVDLLGVFPAHLFFPATKRHNNEWLAVLQLNRLLQMYRYLGFFNYMDEKNLLPTVVNSILKYFPFMLVLCVCTGSALINLICAFGDNIKNLPGGVFTNGIRCRPNTWITNSQFIKPLDRFRLQGYAIYFAASILTLSGVMGFSIQSNIIGSFSILLSIFAYMLNARIIGKAIAEHTSGDSTLLTYQDAMKSIRRFMSSYGVSLELQQHLIAHYELKWQRKRGRDIHESVMKFSRSLREDILFDVYGTILHDASVFISDSRPFLRSVLLSVHHDVAIKNSYITVVNDVNSCIYILFRGRASVLAPDGTKLTTLTPGSMFGNLDDCKMARQTVSVLSLGHAEILHVESVRFHEILRNYPPLHKRYKHLTAIHIDYLEGGGRLGADDDISYTSSTTTNRRSSSKNVFAKIHNKVFDIDNKFVKIWEIIILVLVCYVQIYIALYMMAMCEYGIGILTFQYICDALFIMNYYIKTHTAFENESGIVVKDLGLIKKRFRQNRLIFWSTIISIIPFDIAAFFFPHMFRFLYNNLRLIKIVRFVYVINFFKEQNQKVAVNLYAMRFLFIIIWLMFALHFFTCVLIGLGCIHFPNMHPQIICCNSSRTWYDNIHTYTTYSHGVISIFMASSQRLIYPESWLLILFFILLMVILQLTRATFFAQIYATLQMGYHRQNKYEQQLARIQKYMQREQLSRCLMVRISEYLKLLWKFQRGGAFPSLLEEAPRYLREAVLNSAFAHHINRHFVFKKCHVDFNRQLVACFRNKTYFKDDYIVFRGTIKICMYFIHEGNVVAVSEDDSFRETIVGTLGTGMCFGVTQGLLENTPYSYSFRATCRTVILILDFDMWKHLIHFYPASKVMIDERFAEYEDRYA